MPFPMSRVTMFGAVLCGVISSAVACGIDWEVPHNHFDGVSENGDFSYWRDIGTFDLGEGLKIPLVIGFKPTRGGNSLLGRGWIIPLLESNVVQVDETKFLLTQPDGITRQFWRKKPDDLLLKGQGNWAGQIQGNTIVLWADCGWKLVFSKGKITSITTPKNRVLNVVYGGDGMMKLLENGSAVLQVANTANGVGMKLSFGTNQIDLEMDKRPRVEVVKGLNVVGGYEKSLHRVRLSGAREAVYDFAVDKKMQPTLKIAGDTDRMFTWDAKSGKLIKDGEWSYNIKPGDNWWDNTAQGRINTKNQKEFWFFDKVNGREIMEGIDGTRKVTHYFASGILRGRIRKEEKISERGSEVTYQAVYDEKGKLLREAKDDGVTILYKYDRKGNRIGATSNGKELWSKKYDTDGRLVEEVLENGSVVTYRYLGQDGDCIEKKVLEKNGTRMLQLYQGMREIRRELDDGSIYNYSYDNEGRLTKIIDPKNNVRDLKYGLTGAIIEEYENNFLSYKIFTDESNVSRIMVSFNKDGSVKMARDWVRGKEYENLTPEIINTLWKSLK